MRFLDVTINTKKYNNKNNFINGLTQHTLSNTLKNGKNIEWSVA